MTFLGEETAYGELDILDIAVLYGGDSSEREVSLASGRRVAGALETCGHQVALFDPDEVDLFGINWGQFDACFIALHGGAGEDGRVQVQLEEVGIPYTGSGPLASRLASSKTAAKDRFLKEGIPTPPGVSFHARSPLRGIIARLESLGFPLVIKPDSQGCSLGVNVARSAEDVAACLRVAGSYESFLLAERLVEGREFTVGVIDRRPLPVIEILCERHLLDFDTKFGDAPLQHAFPTDPHTRRVAQVAVDAADALGTRGLARIDLMLDQDGQAWVLEVNTIPGMTERSLVPLAARRAGIGLPSLCDRLVRKVIAVEALV